MMADNNPGKAMAAAVDTKIAAFQTLQGELQQYRTDQQVLLSQQNENEMVKQVGSYVVVAEIHHRILLGEYYEADSVFLAHFILISLLDNDVFSDTPL